MLPTCARHPPGPRMEVSRVPPPAMSRARLDVLANNAAVEHPTLRNLTVRHVPHLPFALGSPYANDKQLAKLVDYYWDENRQGVANAWLPSHALKTVGPNPS